MFDWNSHIKTLVAGTVLTMVPVLAFGQLFPPHHYKSWEDIGSKDYRIYVPSMTTQSSLSEYDKVVQPVRLRTYDNKVYKNDLMFKVHTNMAYDAALAPSGGLELSVGKDWTVGTDAWIAWLRNSRHNAWYEHYGFDIYGRYWFGKKHTRPFTGYHVGPYVGTFTYDLYPENKGYQCNKMFKTFRVGAEFGYAVPVKNFTFDFYAGIGYLHTRQDVYYPNKFSNGYYKAYRRYRNLPDFTRFGVTAGYVFGK